MFEQITLVSKHLGGPPQITTDWIFLAKRIYLFHLSWGMEIEKPTGTLLFYCLFHCQMIIITKYNLKKKKNNKKRKEEKIEKKNWIFRGEETFVILKNQAQFWLGEGRFRRKVLHCKLLKNQSTRLKKLLKFF